MSALSWVWVHVLACAYHGWQRAEFAEENRQPPVDRSSCERYFQDEASAPLRCLRPSTTRPLQTPVAYESGHDTRRCWAARRASQIVLAALRHDGSRLIGYAGGSSRAPTESRRRDPCVFVAGDWICWLRERRACVRIRFAEPCPRAGSSRGLDTDGPFNVHRRQ